MIYRLIILNGERRGEHITITEEPMVIGRGPACDVRIIDPEMAQAHAEVTHRPTGPVINDLGSMNRLLVNNYEVRQSALKHGDIVELGRTRFLVQAYVQAEVAGDAAREPGRRRRLWMAATAVVLVLVLAVLGTLQCRRRGASAPAAAVTPRGPVPTAPARPAVKPVATPEKPKAVPAPVPAPATVAAKAESPIVSEQNRELAAAAAALEEAKSRAMLIDAKERLGAGDLDGAERVLAEVLWLRPDHAPALELRARLQEQRARAEAARQPGPPPPLGGAVAPPSPPTAAETAAVAAAVAVPAPAAALAVTSPPPLPPPPPEPVSGAVSAGVARVRIESVEMSKFPATESFRETRLLSMRLGAAADNVLPEAGAVTVEVLFYERDGATGAVTPAPERGPRQPLLVEGAWRKGEEKQVSASYAVPASEPAERARQYHGFVARVFHHGQPQAAVAQPPDLPAEDGDGPAARAAGAAAP